VPAHATSVRPSALDRDPSCSHAEHPAALPLAPSPDAIDNGVVITNLLESNRLQKMFTATLFCKRFQIQNQGSRITVEVQGRTRA
jgi:hypothetical protein